MPHLVNIGRGKMIKDCGQGNYERNNQENDWDEVASPGETCRCFSPKHKEPDATLTRELVDPVAAFGEGGGFGGRG